MRSKLFLLYAILLSSTTFSQVIAPISVTGFNQDVIAESGNSSLTTTTSALDGVTVSNKVMYTVAFRTSNGFAGGGIPDNGQIPSPGGGVYQLANYTTANALIVPRNQSGALLTTGGVQYNVLRVLAFSTEGASLLNVTLNYSDGTTVQALTNYTLPDWFNGTTNLVLQGFGRVSRATPATGPDAFPANPRLYAIDIPVNCANRGKTLTGITFANVTTAGTNAPFPNAVIFAVSGRVHTQTVAQSFLVVPNCTTAGTGQFTISGSTGPWNISWNTTPAQTGSIATNLLSGVTYTITATDAVGCTFVSSLTGGTDNTFINTRADTTICAGSSFLPGLSSNGATFSWAPVAGVSNPSILNPVLSPVVSTNYVITATLGTCAPRTTAFRVNVLPAPSLSVNNDTTICRGSSFRARTTSTTTVYSWTPATGVSDPTIAQPILSPVTTTTYTVTAGSGSCTETRSFTVNVIDGNSVNAGTDQTIIEGQSIQLSGTAATGTYSWTPSTGLSSSTILNPVAMPAITTTYILTALASNGCISSDEVTITVIPDCIHPMNAITPNGDGINERWLATTGNCFKNIAVKIFNRYGSLVYSNLSYRNDWEGTYKGKPLPDGTYYYLIEYDLLTNQKSYKRGNVTILR